MTSSPPQTSNELKARLKQAYLALEKMEARLKQQAPTTSEPIAVVGLGCRFPGGADSPRTYWRLLSEGRDVIREVPPERWDIETYYDPDPDAPGKMYIRQGGFLDDPYAFDPHFFGITPREAVRLDPQHRLLLEVAWEALENSGIAPSALLGSQTGIFAGLSTFDYSGMHFKSQTPADIDAYFVTGNYPSMAAGRLAYILGVHGPALAVDTACSSALVAVHLAVQSLQRKECLVALAGGVNLILSPELTINFCKNRMLSPTNRCYTFDARADGYIRGEGCGMVVLKRLGDAVAAGDHIWALIKGSAVNHDGASAGLTVPNGPAQEAVIQSALSRSRLAPHAVDYIEAHGTGTPLGDPIEMESLTTVFGPQRKTPLYVGSVKTNLGHTEAAAGIAGLIKTILAVRYAQIPAHLHFKRLNPQIDLDGLPLRIPQTHLSWPQNGHERVAGVSSFGAGGTNAHVVVQEYRPNAQTASVATRDIPPNPQPPHILALSAKTAQGVKDLAARYESYIAQKPNMALRDLCFTANIGRNHFGFRTAIPATSLAELAQGLQTFHQQSTTGNSDQPVETEPLKPVLMFTGQGSQYPHMGKWLYTSEPIYKQAIDTCHEGLKPYLRHPLLAILFPRTQAEAALIHQTENTQPALFAFEWALYQLLTHWGISPAAVMGHSVGEVVAACVAGVFSLESGLALIAKRAALMNALPAGGGMAAVMSPVEHVTRVIQPFSRQVSIAAVNGPQNTVISGDLETLGVITKLFGPKGVATIPLTVSHAFHSPLMEPMLAEFQAFAANITYRPPQLPLVSNVTGTLQSVPENDPTYWPTYWTRHIRQAVLFAPGLQTLWDLGHRVFVEVGPKPILCGMANRIITDPQAVFHTFLQLAQSDEAQHVYNGLARCYELGVAINWHRVYQKRKGRKIELPTYPFQRRPYVFQMNARKPSGRLFLSLPKGNSPLLGPAMEEADTGKTRFEALLKRKEPTFLADHVIHQMVILPATGYVEMALSAAQAVYSDTVEGSSPQKSRLTAPLSLSNLTIRQPMVFPNGSTRTVQLVMGPPDTSGRTFQIYSKDTNQGRSNAWDYHIDGSVSVVPTGEVNPGESLSQCQTACPDHFPAEALYQAYDACGLTLGPAFRTVSELRMGNRESLGRITAAEALNGDHSHYLAHPALLDACFQSAGVLFLDYFKDFNYLPVSLSEITVYHPLPPQLWCHAKLKQLLSSESAPESLHLDFTIFDFSGTLLAQVKGLGFRRTDRQAILKGLNAASGASNAIRYQVDWQRVELESSPPSDTEQPPSHWIILSHREAPAKALEHQLQAASHTCRIILTDSSYLVDETNSRYIIDPTSPLEIEKMLQQTAPKDDSSRNIVFIPADYLDIPNSAMESCVQLLRLTQALLQMKHPPCLWVLTQNAQTIKGSVGKQPNLTQTPLWGFMESLALEHPEFNTRMVDVDDLFNPTTQETLISLLTSASPLTRTAIRNHECFAPRLNHLPEIFPKSPESEGPLFKAQSTYLITGGLGGLGLHLTRWMAANGAQHIVLCGRREPSADARHLIETLADQGISVSAYSTDIGNPQDVNDLLSDIRQKKPPLKGILHAAGVLADTLLLNMQSEDIHRVMHPKIKGAWNLHEASLNHDLDYFVLFSSMTTVLGAQGQANYAAANGFLDALAHYRQSLNLPAVSINWGPWADSGMAAAMDDAALKRLQRMGLMLILPETALNHLSQIMRSAISRAAVLQINWPAYLKNLYGAHPPLFFEAFQNVRSNPPGAQSEPEAQGRLLATLENTQAGSRSDVLMRHVRQRVAEIMQLGDPAQLNLRQRLFDSGMDSLMAVELKNQLENDLKQKLTATLVFDYPTLETISVYLQEAFFPTDYFAASSAPPEDHVPDVLDTDLLDNLDETELKALLANELEEIATEMSHL